MTGWSRVSLKLKTGEVDIILDIFYVITIYYVTPSFE